jgi:hypothetical protein
VQLANEGLRRLADMEKDFKMFQTPSSEDKPNPFYHESLVDELKPVKSRYSYGIANKKLFFGDVKKDAIVTMAIWGAVVASGAFLALGVVTSFLPLTVVAAVAFVASGVLFGIKGWYQKNKDFNMLGKISTSSESLDFFPSKVGLNPGHELPMDSSKFSLFLGRESYSTRSFC